MNNVISFIPQTILVNPINSNYIELKTICNKNIKYVLYGGTSIKDVNNIDHISQCEIEYFTNVKNY